MNTRKQYSPKERKRIFNLHNNCCDNCGSTENLEIAHIVPLAAGGTEKETNLALLCQDCHNKQHADLNKLKLGKCKGGRPIHLMPENWKEIADDYLTCKISRSEAKKLLNISQKSHLQDCKWFKNILKEKDIIEFKNRVEYVNKFMKYKDTYLGYVKYSNETSIYYYNNRKEIVKQ